MLNIAFSLIVILCIVFIGCVINYISKTKKLLITNINRLEQNYDYNEKKKNLINDRNKSVIEYICKSIILCIVLSFVLLLSCLFNFDTLRVYANTLDETTYKEKFIDTYKEYSNVPYKDIREEIFDYTNYSIIIEKDFFKESVIFKLINNKTNEVLIEKTVQYFLDLEENLVEV